jgi:hypothetical protein
VYVLTGDPLAAAMVEAIRSGDLDSAQRLLGEQPGLVSARIHGGRIPHHVATDWHGYFPNGPEVIRILIEAGADPNARTEGKTGETPLHWAASSDDVDVADALVDGGADVESAGGTPRRWASCHACRNLSPARLSGVTRSAKRSGRQATADSAGPRSTYCATVRTSTPSPATAADRTGHRRRPRHPAGNLVTWLREQGAQPSQRVLRIGSRP